MIADGKVRSWLTFPSAIKVYFDGGRREGVASYGWVLFASYDNYNKFNRTWVKIASAAAPLGDVPTVDAELHGAHEAVRAMMLCIEQVWQTAAM